MEASSVQRAGGHAITTDRPVSHGSLSELASTTLMANMTTPSTFPPRELQRPSRAYVHPAADEKDRRSHSDPLGASSGGGRKARDATAGESCCCGLDFRSSTFDFCCYCTNHLKKLARIAVHVGLFVCNPPALYNSSCTTTTVDIDAAIFASTLLSHRASNH